jgi:hypothetical protein
MKKFLILVLLLLALPLVVADSDNYDITSVYVDGIQSSDSSMVQVERDSSVKITVFLEGTGDSTDVRVKVWLGGYEYGDIEEVSEMFEVEDGVTYREDLYLDIPADLDTSENEYTLRVEVYDSQNYEKEEYTIYTESARHKITVEDVVLSSETVSPGEYLGIKVRLENEGENIEEDVKVTISIPELGISSRVYLDELEVDDQEDVSTIYLTIPTSATPGVYEMQIDVEYNNEASETSDFTYLEITGEAVYDENVLVSISSIKGLEVGEESTFKVQVTNLADSSKTFYLSVSGIEAEYTDTLMVTSNSAGEMYLTLSPEEAGLESILVTVTTEEGMVTQKLYNVEVEEASSVLVYLIILAFLVLIAGLGVKLYKK